jgi:hypothetical protein
MTVAEALAAGLGALGGWIGCAQEAVRRVGGAFEGLLDVALRGDPAPAPSPIPRPVARGGPQGEIEEAKFYLGASSPPSHERAPGELPRAYGRDRIVLLPRDPWWAFAYWEVTPVTRLRALRVLGAEAEGAREVLRIYDVTFITFTGDNAWLSFDVEITPGTDHFYLNLSRPAASYLVEIGVRTPTGRFLALARSNTVTLPRPEPSPDTTVRWVRLGRHAPPTSTAAGWGGERVPTPPGPGAIRSGDSRSERTRSSETHAPLPSSR